MAFKSKSGSFDPLASVDSSTINAATTTSTSSSTTVTTTSLVTVAFKSNTTVSNTTSVEALHAHDTRTQSASRKEVNVTTTEQSPRPPPTTLASLASSSSLQLTQLDDSHRIHPSSRVTSYSFIKSKNKSDVKKVNQYDHLPDIKVTNSPSLTAIRSSLSQETFHSPVNQLSSFTSSPVLFVPNHSSTLDFTLPQSECEKFHSVEKSSTESRVLVFPPLTLSTTRTCSTTVSVAPTTNSFSKCNLLTKLTWTTKGVTSSLVSSRKRLSLTNVDYQKEQQKQQQVTSSSDKSRSHSFSLTTIKNNNKKEENSSSKNKRSKLKHQNSIDEASSSFDNEKNNKQLDEEKCKCVNVSQVKDNNKNNKSKSLFNRCCTCQCQYGSDDINSSIEVDANRFSDSQEDDDDEDDENINPDDLNNVTGDKKEKEKQLMKKLSQKSTDLTMAFKKGKKEEANIVKVNSHALNDFTTSTNGQTTSTTAATTTTFSGGNVNITSGCASGSMITTLTKVTPSPSNNELPIAHESIVLIERETWDKKTEFLLAVIGFAVDLGNVRSDFIKFTFTYLNCYVTVL